MQTKNLDIDDLLRKFGPEDPQVVKAMVEVYEQFIYRLARAILNDSEEAADVTQDTFILAARKLCHYQPGTNFKAWLYTITVNNARGAIRKSKARQVMRDVFGIRSIKKTSTTPEEVFLEGENKAVLWRYVQLLNERQRLPIILRIVEELSIKEIAEILDIKEKTVYSRLYDGFRILRALIKKESILAPELGE